MGNYKVNLDVDADGNVYKLSRGSQVKLDSAREMAVLDLISGLCCISDRIEKITMGESGNIDLYTG